MTIDETDGVEWSNGDPGYLVKGHVDMAEMLAAIKAFELAEAMIGSLDEANYDVSHRYASEASAAVAHEHGYEAYTLFCKADDPGAYPVTVAMP